MIEEALDEIDSFLCVFHPRSAFRLSLGSVDSYAAASSALLSTSTKGEKEDQAVFFKCVFARFFSTEEKVASE